MTEDLQTQNTNLRNAHREARVFITEAAAGLRAVLDDESITDETPLEATAAIEEALKAIDAAVARLRPVKVKPPATSPDAPTRQQGQFLAFIRAYMMRNHAGVAPTHANFQRFFNLTAPSVNSMLIRLERRGFIRRASQGANP